MQLHPALLFICKFSAHIDYPSRMCYHAAAEPKGGVCMDLQQTHICAGLLAHVGATG